MLQFKTMVVVHDKMCGGELLQKKISNSRQLRPDCNNGRIIVRRPHVEKGQEVLRSKVLLSSNPLLYTIGFEVSIKFDVFSLSEIGSCTIFLILFFIRYGVI